MRAPLVHEVDVTLHQRFPTLGRHLPHLTHLGGGGVYYPCTAHNQSVTSTKEFFRSLSVQLQSTLPFVQVVAQGFELTSILYQRISARQPAIAVYLMADNLVH